MKMLVAQSRPALCDLMDCNPPGKNTVVGNHLLLYGLLPTKRLSVGLLHCKQIFYHLSHQGRPVENGSWLLSLSQKLIFSPASDGICFVLNVLALRIPLILHLWKKEVESENVRWRGRFHWGGWRCECDGVFITWLWLIERLPRWLSDKYLPANARGVDSIPWWGRSSGEGNSNPLQYSCLGNPMDREAWRAIVRGNAESNVT